MPYNLENKMAEIPGVTEQLDKLDKAGLIYALGYTNYLLLCANSDNKTA